MGARKTCTLCGELGHNMRTCAARSSAQERTNAVKLLPQENPLHWERLRAARSVVAAELFDALRQLSDRSPAVPHIRRAIALLEGCR